MTSKYNKIMNETAMVKTGVSIERNMDASAKKSNMSFKTAMAKIPQKINPVIFPFGSSGDVDLSA